MTAPPLDYGSHDCSRRWPWRLLLGTVGGVLAAGVLLSVPVRTVESRMDAVTGSMTWRTVWPFGVASPTRFDTSPLETRLRQAAIPWTPDWRFLHDTDRTAFGQATRYACGTAPPIYRIQSGLGDFAAASTDDELRAFVRAMETGTEEEQRAAVDAAGEKGLNWLTNGPGR